MKRIHSDVARGGVGAVPPWQNYYPPWENSKLDYMVKIPTEGFFLFSWLKHAR
jgi:hypothetical protein